MTARYTAPNWCNPCGGYRPRAHDCERRAPAPAPAGQAAPSFDLADAPGVSDPRYLAGWRAGYEAAMRDRAERAAAA